MRNKILLLLLLTITKLAYSQGGELILPFFNNGKWGYMNQAKDIIICPRFDEAHPPFNGVARFKTNEKYGYLNLEGEIIIKPKFEEAEDFRRGLAKVTKKNEVYYIKPNGERNTTIGALCGNHNTCSYPKLSSDFIVQNELGDLGVIHKSYYRDDSDKLQHIRDTVFSEFDSIIPITHQLMYLVKDNRIAIVDEGAFMKNRDSKTENNLRFEYEGVKLFECGMCSDGIHNFIGVKQNGLWGYKKLDYELNDFITPKYVNISSFSTGYALVEYEREKFGYIDWRGREYFFR